MVEEVLLKKLASMRRCVSRIKAKGADSAEALANDIDRQDILSLNITRAVQLCVDIAGQILAKGNEAAPASMAGAFDELRTLGFISATLSENLRASVGFRNVAVHNDRRIDWDIVHAITWYRIDGFRDFARTINDY